MKKTVKVKNALVLHEVERRNLIIALIILFLLVGGLLYYFAYPRVSFEVETWYSEGFLGSVSLDVTLRNRAPIPMESTTLRITLLNSTEHVLASSSRTNVTVGAWETFSTPSLYISGAEMGNNTYSDVFTIIVELSFMANSGHSHRFEYKTHGDYMNLFFSERVGSFPF